MTKLLRHCIATLDGTLLAELRQTSQAYGSPTITAGERMHSSGVLALRSGRIPLAIACLKHAAALAASKGAYVSLGDALLRAGRDDEALSAYLHTLIDAPDDAALHVALSRALNRCGRLHEALNLAYRALDLEDCVATRLQAGWMLRACGRPRLAIEHYERCMTFDHHCVEALQQLGDTYLQIRQWQAALDIFGRAAVLECDRPGPHVGISKALVALGRFREAEAALRATLVIAPTQVAALQQWALLSQLPGHGDDSAAIWTMLGEALQASGRTEEAAQAFRRALSCQPGRLRALINLGDVELLNNRPHAAVEALERAVAISPQHSHAHTSLSKAYHLSGDPQRGLREFAWRSVPSTMEWRGFEQPVWDGSPLVGKTILVWSNPRAGIGDAIHLYRYCPLIKDRGLRLIIECQPRLLELARTVPGVDAVVARGLPLPHFDVHAPTSRLPVVLDSVPWPYTGDVPYVSIDRVLVNAWRGRLARWPGPRVGLVWGGAPARPDASVRFVPLRTLAPLGRHRGVNLLSLQMGRQAEELLDLPEGFEVHQALDDSHSLMDTAAAIACLDLLITVDTMIAHLAGALGAQVWTLLAHGADWRWLSGDRTPWYPTMRLWRQGRQGDWRELAERVSGALAEALPTLMRKG